jgi:NADH-quinone oxidoreductase subunit C
MTTPDIQNHPVAQELAAALPDAIVEAKLALSELTLFIAPERIVDVCRHLRTAQKFVRLSSVTAVDWSPAEPRFEVVYHLHSIERNLRLRLKCRLNGERPEIESVTSVWRGANWYEREVFDLFGVVFRNHPNLKRIMLPEDWEGHPLRKDTPVHGFKYSYQKE